MSEFLRYEHEQMDQMPRKQGDGSVMPYVMNGPQEEEDKRISYALNGIFTSLTRILESKIAEETTDTLPFPTKMLGIITPVRQYPVKDYPVFKSGNTDLLREFDEYVEIENHRIKGPIFRIPLGYYGESFSRALAKTEQVLISLVAEKMKIECTIEDARNFEFIKDETFHGNTLRTLQEAIQSEGAAFALLTGEGFEGYEDDPVGLVKEIEKQDVVRKLSAISPLGIIVPSVNNGYGFKSPLVRTDSGLALSPDVIRLLVDEKKADPHPSRPSERQRGCPASYINTPLVLPSGRRVVVPESAVTKLTRIFTHYFEHIYSKEMAEESNS